MTVLFPPPPTANLMHSSSQNGSPRRHLLSGWKSTSLPIPSSPTRYVLVYCFTPLVLQTDSSVGSFLFVCEPNLDELGFRNIRKIKNKNKNK
ncbi:hypothetical protein LINGRAPRIM_LOCUS2184 [Linum grandiflorum]